MQLFNSIIMKESSGTQYVLIPKNIFDRFFKEVKVGKKRVSGILDETAVKQAIKRRKNQEKDGGLVGLGNMVAGGVDIRPDKRTGGLPGVGLHSVRPQVIQRAFPVC